jgi:hypothetical protein
VCYFWEFSHCLSAAFPSILSIKVQPSAEFISGKNKRLFVKISSS